MLDSLPVQFADFQECYNRNNWECVSSYKSNDPTSHIQQLYPEFVRRRPHDTEILIKIKIKVDNRSRYINGLTLKLKPIFLNKKATFSAAMKDESLVTRRGDYPKSIKYLESDAIPLQLYPINFSGHLEAWCLLTNFFERETATFETELKYYKLINNPSFIYNFYRHTTPQGLIHLPNQCIRDFGGVELLIEDQQEGEHLRKIDYIAMNMYHKLKLL